MILRRMMEIQWSLHVPISSEVPNLRIISDDSPQFVGLLKKTTLFVEKVPFFRG